jgi:Mor family transcriptional regulator
MPWNGKIGTAHYAARLDADKVRAIRAAYGPGVSYNQLARHYGVSHVAIFKVVNRKSWRHVT